MNAFVPAPVLSLNPPVHAQFESPSPRPQELPVQKGPVGLGVWPSGPKASAQRPCCGVQHHPGREGQETVGTTFGPGRMSTVAGVCLPSKNWIHL